MSDLVQKTVVPYTAQRVTLTSSKPLYATLAALYEELNKDKAGLAMRKLLGEATSKEEIDRKIGELTEGKRDFVFFAASSQTRWLNLLLDESQQLAETHVIHLGNPLIAKTFVQYDARAAMYVPPKILVQETEEGGTRVVYDLPSSSVLHPDSPPEMREPVIILDKKLEKMVTRVLAKL